MTPKAYSDFLRTSVLWHQEVSVPEKGDYYLRIGIHNLMSDKMGGVEVPISWVEHLPPASRPAAKPNGDFRTRPQRPENNLSFPPGLM